MKILFIISSLSSGGAERVLTTLANYWNNKQWHIEVFVLSNSESFYTLNDSIKTYYSKRYHTNSLLNYLRQTKDIREAVKESKPDIVISFLDILNITTLIATIGIKTPVVISERNHFHTLKSNIWRRLRRMTYPFAKGAVLLSNYDFDKYSFVKNKKIIVNPLQTEELLPVKFEDKEKLIIAVGSLSKQKGFDMLIEAVAKTNIQGWRVMIIGEGEEREYLTSLIDKYKLQNSISLIGRKNNIFDYYKKASIFLLSSRYEGFPNVLNEAMAHGCSCIAFDCKTGPSDIIENQKSGLLVEANNIQKLHEALESTINDESLREKFFHESIKIREKNSLEKIAKEWEDYLEGLIDE